MQHSKRLLVIGAETYFGREIVMGIHAYCRFHGSWEFHLEGDNNPEMLRQSRLAVRQWHADGIITAVCSVPIERMVRNAGIPVVNVSGARKSDLPGVWIDNVGVGRMVARHFLDSGFQNFAFSAKTSELFSHERCEGFVGELTKAGFTCDIFTDRCTSAHKESNWVNNRRRMDQWLLSLRKPVAIFSIYDLRGREVADACRHLGLRVPDDVAVVGVSNEESLCLMCNPALSSVDTNTQRIGYEAAHLLDRMLRGDAPPTQPIRVAPLQVVSRASSDTIAIDDTDVVAAVRHIRNFAHEPMSVKDLLAQVPVSRKTLEMRFIKHLGRTPGAELAQVRLERSKRLLEETDLSIPAVARSSGFTSADTFAAFFRRKTGLPPSRYRHRRRAEDPTAHAHRLEAPAASVPRLTPPPLDS